MRGLQEKVVYRKLLQKMLHEKDHIEGIAVERFVQYIL